MDSIDATELYALAFIQSNIAGIYVIIRIAIVYWIFTIFLRLVTFFLIHTNLTSKVFWNNSFI